MTITEKFEQMERDCALVVAHFNGKRNYNMAQMAQSVLTTIGGFNQHFEAQKVEGAPEEEFPPS